MNLEHQVTSLELAKQLKEAGYEQEGLWWWVFPLVKDATPYLANNDFVRPIKVKKKLGHEVEKIIVALTVAELGEALQNKAGQTMTLFDGSCWHSGNRYPSSEGSKFIEANTEANARAKMGLYLKKEKLL